MKRLARRRTGNVVILAVIALALAARSLAMRDSLSDDRLQTGWLLGALVLFLALYNARKKLPFLPLGSSATWLQLHVYGGLLAIVVFALHLAFGAPTGLFEGLLATVFALVALSGVGGLWLSRAIPRRLARRGEEVLFERIPAFLHRLSDEAQELALSSVQATRSSAVADFHATRLADFLAAPRHAWSHVRDSRAPLAALESEMGELRRRVGDDARPFVDGLAEIARTKDDLDYHWANQGLLKVWLFLHVPLTYSLLLLVLAHVVLVTGFGSPR